MKLAVLDLETDPFEHGKVPRPFVAGFYDGEQYVELWGDNCCTRLVDWLTKCESGPYCIYAHNGGRFDFFYFMQYLERDLQIVNSRIIKGHIGAHEVRDSYAILPFPLRDFDKDEIDYELMRPGVRDKHRAAISKYLKKDCTSLYTLVEAFRDEFGDNLTVGGSSLKQLKKRHTFACGGPVLDRVFRNDFYFGGRVSVFKPGIIRMPMKVIDVNSMYPFVMQSCLHPAGNVPILGTRINNKTCFVVAEGKNYGAFPTRDDNGGLTFERESGRFCTTIHEWQAAEQTGSFKAARVVKTYGFDNRITFDDFIVHFYGERKLAKFRGDKIHALFYKYVLNSAYGKFAQNPENYCEYEITGKDAVMPHPCEHDAIDGCKCDLNTCGKCWDVAFETDEYVIWSRPTPSAKKRYYNVCIGASITGAARAVLLRGIHAAVDPIYCDTDSIICRDVRSNLQLDNSDLGAWKLEATGTLAAISGKKLYAIYDTDRLLAAEGEIKCRIEGRAAVCVKKAHKGAHLTPEEIWRIAKGETVESVNISPSFSLSGKHVFIKRKIRRTV